MFFQRFLFCKNCGGRKAHIFEGPKDYAKEIAYARDREPFVNQERSSKHNEVIYIYIYI